MFSRNFKSFVLLIALTLAFVSLGGTSCLADAHCPCCHDSAICSMDLDQTPATTTVFNQIDPQPVPVVAAAVPAVCPLAGQLLNHDQPVNYLALLTRPHLTHAPPLS